MGYILIVVLIVVALFFFIFKFKTLRLDAITMINGGVKCGKTTLAVYLACKEYKKKLFNYRIKCFISKLLRFKNVIEKPLFYSNIPLNIKGGYVPLTLDIIERKKRLNYKSVVLISESSLLINSQEYKDKLLNEKVMLFFKLFGHETKGGAMFVETQALADNHYNVKRSLNRFIWIHSLIKWIPFVLIYRVREMMYNEECSTNSINEDLEDSTRYVIAFKSAWKKFDCYTYSKFTDNLEIEKNVINPVSLQSNGVTSFIDYQTISNNNIIEAKPPKIKKKVVIKNEKK